MDHIFKALAKFERQRKLLRDSLAAPDVKERLIQQVNDQEAALLREHAPPKAKPQGGSEGSGAGAPEGSKRVLQPV